MITIFLWLVHPVAWNHDLAIEKRGYKWGRKSLFWLNYEQTKARINFNECIKNAERLLTNFQTSNRWQQSKNVIHRRCYCIACIIGVFHNTLDGSAWAIMFLFRLVRHCQVYFNIYTITVTHHSSSIRTDIWTLFFSFCLALWAWLAALSSLWILAMVWEVNLAMDESEAGDILPTLFYELKNSNYICLLLITRSNLNLPLWWSNYHSIKSDLNW